MNTETEPSATKTTAIETTKVSKPRIATGKVVSDKADKTIVVLVSRKVKHPVVGKYVIRSTKLMAHDEKNESRIGDTVTIREHRPISKRKTWMLDKIIDRDLAEEISS